MRGFFIQCQVGGEAMEFVSWLIRYLGDIKKPAATIFMAAAVISLIVGLTASPVSTMLGLSIWLALMYYLYLHV
jgi:hypothetical protein